MLTQKQIEFYRANGYLGVENVLSPEEVDELRRVTNEFIDTSRTITEHTPVFDLEPGHSAETPRVRRIKSPVTQHPIYDRTLRHDRILDIVAQLIGPAIRTNGNKLNVKYAEFGSPVEWHQDWAFYPHTNDDLLAVGVALDDMNQENGCLMVIPGSHKDRVLDHHQDGHFAGAVTEEDFTAENAAPVEVRAGGISIHHVRALHGSAPNTSSRPRRLLLYQYCAGDAWPLAQPMKSWEDFAASFLRGEPSNQPRVTSVPVRLPLPSAVRTGSIYETQTILKRTLYGKKAS